MKIKYIIISLLLCSGIIAQRKFEVQTNLGVGFTRLRLGDDYYKSVPGISGSGDLLLRNFFSSSFGLETGLIYSTYNTRITADDKMFSIENPVDEIGKNSLLIYSHDFKEDVNFKYLELPVGLASKINFSNKFSGRASLGIKIGMPLSSSYAYSGNMSTRLYYPDVMYDESYSIKDLPSWGLYENKTDWDHKSGDYDNMAINFSVYSNIGLAYALSDKVSLYGGVAISYGMTDVVESSESYILEPGTSMYNNSYYTYNSTATLVSSLIDDVSLKIGFVFQLEGKEKHSDDVVPITYEENKVNILIINNESVNSDETYAFVDSVVKQLIDFSYTKTIPSEEYLTVLQGAERILLELNQKNEIDRNLSVLLVDGDSDSFHYDDEEEVYGRMYIYMGELIRSLVYISSDKIYLTDASLLAIEDFSQVLSRIDNGGAIVAKSSDVLITSGLDDYSDDAKGREYSEEMNVKIDHLQGQLGEFSDNKAISSEEYLSVLDEIDGICAVLNKESEIAGMPSSHSASANVGLSEEDEAERMQASVAVLMKKLDYISSEEIQLCDASLTAIGDLSQILSRIDDGDIVSESPHSEEDDVDAARLNGQLIHFPFNKTIPTQESFVILDDLVEAFSREEGDISIVGHADKIGYDAINEKISRKRAYFIYSYLVKSGIESSRIHIAWEGEKNPIDDSSYAKNRRVEVLLRNSKLDDVSSVERQASRHGVDAYVHDPSSHKGAPLSVENTVEDKHIPTDLSSTDNMVCEPTIISNYVYSIAELTDIQKSEVKKIVDSNVNTEVKYLLVGHTCDYCYDNTNLKAGHHRASVLKEYMVSIGVEPASILVTSGGEHCPLYPNTSESNRRKNRRVDIYTTNSSGHFNIKGFTFDEESVDQFQNKLITNTY